MAEEIGKSPCLIELVLVGRDSKERANNQVYQIVITIKEKKNRVGVERRVHAGDLKQQHLKQEVQRGRQKYPGISGRKGVF